MRRIGLSRQAWATAALLLSGCRTDAASQVALLSPAPGSPVQVGPASGHVVLGDLNSDGRLDLVTAHPLDSLIRWQVGDGRGGFAKAPSATLTIAFAPSDLKLIDVNGDRALDLVTTAGDRDVVAVLLGDGTGAFRHAPRSPFTVSPTRYRFNKRYVHVVDVNGDGKPDVVTANRRGQTRFRVMLGAGDGRFAPGPMLTLDTAQATYTLAFADFDGDARVDVAVVSAGTDQGSDSGHLAVHKGDGTGAFSLVTASRINLPNRSRLEAVGDLDGNGLRDLVVSSEDSRLQLLRNAGGTFSNYEASPIEVGKRTHEISLSDVDDDGRLDIVAAVESGVAVLLQSSSGGFVHAPGSPYRAGPGAYHVFIADVNGDRRRDAVASSFESTAITVLLRRAR